MGADYYTHTFDSNTVIVTITSALVLYNAVELLLLIFTTFTVFRGLYFWSLFIATSGLIPYAVGWTISYFRATQTVAGLVINNIGWWTTVTGQSVVLYSRLGVVLGKGHDKILKYVKWMIIVDCFLLHGTTTVVVFGSYYAPQPAQQHFSRAYQKVEKIQMTWFCCQEFIISGLYLWATRNIVRTQPKVLRSGSTISDQGQKSRGRVMGQLFIINLIIVAMDIALLVIEYKDLHTPEVAFKGLCYAIKLKLEFAVLSKLVEVAGSQKSRKLSYATVLDTSQLNEPDGLHITKSNPNFIVDPSRKAGTAKVASPPSQQSSDHSIWVEDLEKADVHTTGHNNGHLSLEDAMRRESDISSYNNISVSEGPHHRRARRESDVMYADIIREIEKPD